MYKTAQPDKPEIFRSNIMHIIKIMYARCSPANGVSTLTWWWGLSAPETLSYAGGSVAIGRVTHAGQVKG
jgi:hypothetical protein